jgi:hypothetical protein
MKPVHQLAAELPALSIRQPWAWFILHIGKDIENRTWRHPPRYRGPLLVHASKGMTKDEYLDASEFALAAVDDSYKGRGIVFPDYKEMQRGGIVGMVDLVDVVTESESPWFMGTLGFVLANPRPLPFTPCKGQLGFFTAKVEPVQARQCPICKHRTDDETCPECWSKGRKIQTREARP